MAIETDRPQLTIDLLKIESREFCTSMSSARHGEIVGVTDGKAVGTYIEHAFKNAVKRKYLVEIGNSAQGIDFPELHINTDVKTTFIKQPQSSCPFKDAAQKIYGLGYNILLFVYQKDDSKNNNLQFLHCRFIDKSRTADYQTTRGLRDIIHRNGNTDDIKAFLTDRNLPVDEISLENIAKQILANPPKIGYLTISNALQWRLQYMRVISLSEEIEGISKVYDYPTRR